MAKLPRPVRNLIEAFERLPGIGPKTAQRLSFYLLHVPQIEIEKFARALMSLKTGTVICSLCFNVAENDPCQICRDPNREQTTLLVVEQPVDVLHFEQTGKYRGLYHVLHGRIDPLNNIGPEDIYLDQLFQRIEKSLQSSFIKSVAFYEVVLAMNTDMEGEATAMYIRQQLQSQGSKFKAKVKVTRLAYGLPVGASVEFADERTLLRALEGRREMSGML